MQPGTPMDDDNVNLRFWKFGMIIK